GNVIIIGRGANVVTARLDHVFHVRLVGSVEKRIERVKERLGMSAEAAAEYIARTDRGRERYLKEHYDADINDPLLYDLIINTDRTSCENAAMTIAGALLRRAFGMSFAGKDLA
ncbi:MAG: cytidylate kinase-like family protein, partial [Verrucomicrobiae bacterium]|nr:cytidylate kinase-like family protein [Verrucomicrobiae bacterium]